MSTIFSSAFARQGILPATTPRNQPAGHYSTAAAPAIGGELHDADTITFRRLAGDRFVGSEDDTDAELFKRVTAIVWKPNTCYLPWCAECYEPLAATGDTNRIHLSAPKSVTVWRTYEDGSTSKPQFVTFQVEQVDDDKPGETRTGEPVLLVSVGDEPGPAESSDMAIPTDHALLIGQTFINFAQMMGSTSGVANPNEIDPVEYERDRAEWDARLAEFSVTRQQAAKDAAIVAAATERAHAKVEADKADPDSTINRAARAREAGTRAAESRFGRRFPRLAFTVLTWRLAVDDRCFFAMGMDNELARHARHAAGKRS